MAVLLSTLHDPGGKFARIKNAEKLVEGATSNYAKSVINITRATSARTKKLAERHFERIYSGTGTMGEHMVSLMKHSQAKGGTFHYCDFDRLLHWQLHYPKELRRTAGAISKSKGFVFINRTRRAFESHPETQKDTETIMNMLVSAYMGRRVDIGSGTFGFDRKACRKFAGIRGDVSELRFLGHFVACVKKSGMPVKCMNSEGIEWETPDIHQDDIRRMGYKRWLAGFQSQKEWTRRVESLRQVAEILMDDF